MTRHAGATAKLQLPQLLPTEILHPSLAAGNAVKGFVGHRNKNSISGPLYIDPNHLHPHGGGTVGGGIRILRIIAPVATVSDHCHVIAHGLASLTQQKSDTFLIRVA